MSGYDPQISINNLAEALKQCSQIAERFQAALEVIARTPHIQAYLTCVDPKALEQVNAALGNEVAPMPDLKSMKLVWDALQQFRDNSAEVADDEKCQREAVHAQHLIERIEAGLVPAMEREDRIFAQEVERERYKDFLAASDKN